MTLEEAIKTAIDYEEKVRDVYLQARSEATNDVGKRVFRILSKEEQEHVDFLRRKQAELQDTGKVTAEKLATAIPSREAIAEGLAKLENKMESEDLTAESHMAQLAFDLEFSKDSHRVRHAAALCEDIRSRISDVNVAMRMDALLFTYYERTDRRDEGVEYLNSYRNAVLDIISSLPDEDHVTQYLTRDEIARLMGSGNLPENENSGTVLV